MNYLCCDYNKNTYKVMSIIEWLDGFVLLVLQHTTAEH